MGGVPIVYCGRCDAMRAIKDWREKRGVLIIKLDSCGHLSVRNARLEWAVPSPRPMVA